LLSQESGFLGQNDADCGKLRNQLPVAKKQALRRTASQRAAVSAACRRLDAADGLQAGAGVDFGLRQHRGLGAEALNQ
jgi:hypothetical protein